jgi:hypothetical protein
MGQRIKLKHSLVLCGIYMCVCVCVCVVFCKHVVWYTSAIVNIDSSVSESKRAIELSSTACLINTVVSQLLQWVTFLLGCSVIDSLLIV